MSEEEKKAREELSRELGYIFKLYRLDTKEGRLAIGWTAGEGQQGRRLGGQ